MHNDLTPPPPELLNMRGRYFHHYKGGLYKVVAIVRNSETKVFEVVYESVDRDDELPWSRPATTGDAPFLGMVEVTTDIGFLEKQYRFLRVPGGPNHPIEFIILNPLRNK